MALFAPENKLVRCFEAAPAALAFAFVSCVPEPFIASSGLGFVAVVRSVRSARVPWAGFDQVELRLSPDAFSLVLFPDLQCACRCHCSTPLTENFILPK